MAGGREDRPFIFIADGRYKNLQLFLCSGIIVLLVRDVEIETGWCFAAPSTSNFRFAPAFTTMIWQLEAPRQHH